MSRKKLTIGIIQQSPDLGGAETLMLSLIAEFKAYKADIFLASNDGLFLEYAKKLPIKTIRIPMVLDIIGNYKGLIKSLLLLPFAIYFYCKVLMLFKRRQVDVLLMSGFSEKMLVTFLSFFIKIPVIWIEHGPLQKVIDRNFRFPRILYLKLHSIARQIIVPSNLTAKSLKVIGVPSQKITRIYNGTQIPKKVNRKKNENIVIGNVSRLAYEKGQRYLVLAMSEIVKVNPGVKAIIVGEGPDRDYINQLVKNLKLDGNIKVVGYKNDLEKIYNSIDVFVFPTTWELEGFGLVAIEAMAHGIPVVGFRFGPLVEIIDNEIDGILVPVGDYKKLAAAINFLIVNKEKRLEMGASAYKKVLYKFNLKRTSSKYLEIFEKYKNDE